MYRARDIECPAQGHGAGAESTIATSRDQGRRKAILFVSQTIGRVGASQNDTFSWLDRATRQANANNTTIYSFDPRGLDMNMRPSDILRSLADNTGGRQFSNNYPATALREIVKHSSAFYLRGTRRPKIPPTGSSTRSRWVKRPGVEVRARPGYFAPSLNDRTPPGRRPTRTWRRLKCRRRWRSSSTRRTSPSGGTCGRGRHRTRGASRA